jgi:hypothetical protein
MSSPTAFRPEPSSVLSALPSGITVPQEIINATDQGGLVAMPGASSLGLVFVSFSMRTYVRSKLSTYRVDEFAFLGAFVRYFANVFCDFADGFVGILNPASGSCI